MELKEKIAELMVSKASLQYITVGCINHYNTKRNIFVFERCLCLVELKGVGCVYCLSTHVLCQWLADRKLKIVLFSVFSFHDNS